MAGATAMVRLSVAILLLLVVVVAAQGEGGLGHDPFKGTGKGDGEGKGPHHPPPPPHYYSHPPPPPPHYYSHPPPPPPHYSHSPPPPPPSMPTPSPPPPPPSTPSPPPPSPPPPPTPSPPPPSTPSPPPPSPPPPSTPSPPPPSTPSPPPPSTPTPSPSPPPPSTPSPPPPSTPTPSPSPPPPPPSTPSPPPPSTPTPTPSSPPPEPPFKCDLLSQFIFCHKELKCPVGCPTDCEFDCDECKAKCPCDKAGTICQDPRFVGGDGMTFYFHGKKDQDFCIVSDSNLHINAHFIGRRNNNMKRDFTWVQSLGILFDNHQLFVGAQKTSTWDDSVDRLAIAFDGEPIFLPATEGAQWRPSNAPGVSFTRSRDVNGVVIEVEGNFKVKATVVPITEKDSKIHNYGITKEDCFAHLDLGFKFNSLSAGVDGVLGQTYSSNYVSKIKVGVLMPVVGGAKEFASSTLFSADCAVAKFTGHFNSSESFEQGTFDCASTGMDGPGVVCKR